MAMLWRIGPECPAFALRHGINQGSLRAWLGARDQARRLSDAVAEKRRPRAPVHPARLRFRLDDARAFGVYHAFRFAYRNACRRSLSSLGRGTVLRCFHLIPGDHPAHARSYRDYAVAAQVERHW